VKEALSVSSNGNVPLDYDLTSGRTADLATVQANRERLCHLRQRCGYLIDQVVIIGDRGTLNDKIAIKYQDKGLKHLAGLNAHKKEHAELRLPRLHPALTGSSEPLSLPAPPTATQGQATGVEIA